MINTVSFEHNGSTFSLFIEDTDTGYTGIDMITKPGVYAEVVDDSIAMMLAELHGHINGYTTKCMALVVAARDDTVDTANRFNDVTDYVKQLLTVPETGAKMILANLDEDARSAASTALDVIHFYEKVTTETKVFLPPEAMVLIDKDTAEKMKSSRQVYVLKSSDNKEIVQRDCTSEYGIVLPTVDELHSTGGGQVKPIDILRVIAPCRKPIGDGGAFQYNGIYHTPYYRVDPRIRGTLPSYLGFLMGYPKNDTLDIQQNERHMRDNLRTFVHSDVARYVSEIVTGLFLSTHLGQTIRKFITCNDDELTKQLASELSDISIAGSIKCEIAYSDLQEIISQEHTVKDMASLISRNIAFTADSLGAAVDDMTKVMHIVDVENLPFVLQLEDDIKEQLTEKLIASNVITRAMFEYLLNLCLCAYAVNWGHTGATKAISRFVAEEKIDTMNSIIGAYLSQMIGNIPAPSDMNFSVLYSTQTKSYDEDDDSDDEDEIFTELDRYISKVTARKIREGMDIDLFNSATPAVTETSEAAIVEYWKRVDGDSHLSYFISSAFTTTCSYSVLFEAFIKLMRWGSVKPSLLVFQEYPEIRTVFDLNIGKEIPNTAIVDESKLVLSDGCEYSLEHPVYAEDIVGAGNALVGFVLSKNYGIKKYFLASLVAVGEMIQRGEVDIDAFKSVSDIDFGSDNYKPITGFENSGYQFVASNMNIDDGLKYNIPPAQLSELYLLTTPGILRTVDYLRSKQNTMVVTTTDRQYQILSRYCEAIRTLYKTDSSTLAKAVISTAELSSMAVKVYNIFTSSDMLPDANQVRAATAIKSMNLDDGINYLDIPLEGKFTIISDVDMQSDLPSIKLSDPMVKQVANKVRDRIVMLMLETQSNFVLCRKDISASELLVIDHKIEHRKYSTFAPVIKALKNGQTVNISNAKTGARHPAALHISMREFL